MHAPLEMFRHACVCTEENMGTKIRAYVSTKKNYDKKISLPIFIYLQNRVAYFDFLLLFSIDKEARLITFTTIICDRYSFSSLVQKKG
jgi:thymidylate kinase